MSEQNNNDVIGDDFLDNDLMDNAALSQKEAALITKARRRITEANKTAFIKYRMLSVDEFREILAHKSSVLRYKNNELGWQDQPPSYPTPLWFGRLILDWKMPLIYPKNLFD